MSTFAGRSAWRHVCGREHSAPTHIDDVTAIISFVCTSLPLEGLPSRKQACKGVIDPVHRNEIVAGGMSDHLTHAYKAAMDAVAYRAGDFFEASTIHRTYGRLSISSFLSDPPHQLPQIVFTLRAVQHPASIPLSVASLTLITQTTQFFTLTLFSFFDSTSSIADKLSSLQHQKTIRGWKYIKSSPRWYPSFL